ncbi:MAG: methylated-DNA-[protein]-cysteineS-methyltransfe rase [Fibrobacteria bacterium]|jgi:methylated-DNA-[protein]-cysteine S-methyltransferase|nr:methylated-DNA-[protein]-cysteineS-methyltransfe rase [Fibrobacteria bacterium]
MIRYARVATPVGFLLIAADARGLVSAALSTPAETISVPRDWKKDPAFFAPVEKAVRAFFEQGKPLPRLPRGEARGSAFQLKVWKAIEEIPFGETRSYGEIAERIGHPRAARAVGTACGSNPLMLFTPCHRVLAARGAIGGYGFCGIEIKKKLLRIEGSWDPGG